MRKIGIIFTTIYMIFIYICLYIFKDNESMRILLGTFIFPLIGAGISIFWICQYILKLTGKQKYVWVFLAMGNLSFIIAQSIWYYQITLYKVPSYPSWADFLWLVQYLLYLSALIIEITITKGVPFVRFIFNISIFMTTAIALSIHFLITPILASSSNSIWEVTFSLAYPIIDLALLFVTIGLLYLSKYSVNKKVLSIIIVGLFFQIFADTAHTYLLSKGNYVPGGFVDPLWILPLLIIGIASIYARYRLGQQVEYYSQTNHEYNLIPYVGAFILLISVLFNHGIHSVGSLGIGLFLVMVLIVIRQNTILIVNRNLLQELTETNDELTKSEERYRHLVEISPHAIAVDIKGKLVFINKAGLELLGATSYEQIIGKSIYDFIDKNYIQTYQLQREKADSKQTLIEQCEYPVKRIDGEIIYVESRIAEINYNGEKAFLAVTQDVTYRKNSEERIKHMAFFDELTELPNRAMFHKNINKKIEKAREHNNQVAVMFIDLDRFKFINDTMGHSFGDVFLKNVSTRMVQLLGHHGTIYRFGGDEFCVILDIVDQEKAEMIAQKIIDGFSKLFNIGNHEFYTTPSIGISFYPKDGEDEDLLIKQADIAMYKAKNLGGNNYQLYTPVLDKENSNKMEMENALRRAIVNHEFFIHYQPKVNLHTGEIVGLEALIRWKHPDWGLVSPLQFISIAEETGLIIPIGTWILHEACLQLKKWHNEGFSTLSIAVNISPRQFQDKDFLKIVRNVFRDIQLDPQFLQIEITESIMNNFQGSLSTLTELKQLGIKISIDDFGTGYSSLSYLKYLPIDEIKIDKSFVDDISINQRDIAIVKTIIDMGHHLHVFVTAEGIETKQQYLVLKEHHCNVGQGYLFSKPLPPAEVEQLFNQSFLK
ncbi:EAL domain-containing protein [Neobacillus sp. PS3-40]|uniref:putative bifunctional diguanylate cyclase/phosphodiesterase n=1 Tax=Neobacillus sp. PS3-40 TaxID=3070679 RepID=UPI0027DFCB50|nr:EAL domain-containing protein [Neobacillus sp. PS3-40]WML46335.1 EAL domain-containing protein [Neobacillus sp. PS3-40]